MRKYARKIIHCSVCVRMPNAQSFINLNEDGKRFVEMRHSQMKFSLKMYASDGFGQVLKSYP